MDTQTISMWQLINNKKKKIRYIFLRLVERVFKKLIDGLKIREIIFYLYINKYRNILFVPT